MQKGSSALIGAFFILLFATSIARADSFFIGHNLSPSTETPTAGSWTAGTYLVAYAPNDQCIVGTSAWMVWNYNSYSAIARCRLIHESSWFTDTSLQLAFIKSDASLGDTYRQTVGIVWWTVQNKINDIYTVYSTLNFMHFWDETFPFSLRRDPGNNQPYQFSLSTLHRLRWTDHVGFNLEFGVLGLNYRTPLVHNGYSVYWLEENFLIQLGLSISAVPNNSSRLFSAAEARKYSPGYDHSVHPEIQFQYAF